MQTISQLARWDPTNPIRWAEYLGLAHVPMFAPHRDANEWAQQACMLIDGHAANVSMYLLEDTSALWDERPFSWSWSANARHLLMIDAVDERLFTGHYWTEEPLELRQRRLPENASAARAIIEELHATPVPTGEDAIVFSLRLFRSIRAQLPRDANLEALQIFNALLAGTRSVCDGALAEDDWLRADTFAEVAELIHSVPLGVSGLDEVVEQFSDLRVGSFVEYLGSPAPETGLRLDPGLLIRHAAGELYQEAHLLLEKHLQLAFPGWTAGKRSIVAPERADVRFTPASLARLLVQQALMEVDLRRQQEIKVLDPACGSGVFLQIALEELSARDYSGRVLLQGMDLSPIARSMAEFVLEQARHEHPSIDTYVTITRTNALCEDWNCPDVILMNPPFLSWTRMEEPDKELVTELLGDLAHGRADMAMAFLWKACQSIETGVIASVFPAPLLETNSGVKWREALSQAGNIRLLGRFQGYGYFRGSTVEPAFIVLKLPQDNPGTTEMVVAQEGAEHHAIRALRRAESGIPEDGAPEWDVITVPEESIVADSWLPREGRHVRLIQYLHEGQMPRIGDLFHVRQGIRTGCNEAFLLSAGQMQELPQSEHEYFRPAITTGAIHFGTLDPEFWVFYPYREGAPAFEDCEELRQAVQVYFEQHLQDRRNELMERSDVAQGRARWWELSTFRTWQDIGEPRLVSTYFGQSGSFAYDELGDHVVVQGHAWIWSSGPLVLEVDAGNGAQEEVQQVEVDFHDTLLPWAYLAFFNSIVFDQLLACFAPRVSGGQFDLSPRHVNRVFVPDLSDEQRIPSEAVVELAQMGRRIHRGEPVHQQELTSACASGYGLDQVLFEFGVD
jgi:adenine-specific DNA-methyltransferase